MSTEAVSGVTGFGFLRENKFLHLTVHVPSPYNLPSSSQVTIKAFTAHSNMKLVPDLGSFTGTNRRRYVPRPGRRGERNTHEQLVRSGFR